MNSLGELDQKFDLDVLSEQLKTAVDSKDPLGYMRSNINWEIDKDLDAKPNLDSVTSMMTISYSANIGYEMWNPFRKFLEWLGRNKTANQIKKILCKIYAEIQKLIDEEAGLKKLITVALTAIAAAIGLGAINPMIPYFGCGVSCNHDFKRCSKFLWCLILHYVSPIYNRNHHITALSYSHFGACCKLKRFSSYTTPNNAPPSLPNSLILASTTSSLISSGGVVGLFPCINNHRTLTTPMFIHRKIVDTINIRCRITSCKSHPNKIIDCCCSKRSIICQYNQRQAS